MSFRQGVVTTKPENKAKVYKKEAKGKEFFIREAEGQGGLSRFEIVMHERDNNHLLISLFAIEDVGNSDYFIAKGLKQLGHRVVAIRQRNNEHDYPTDLEIHKMESTSQDPQVSQFWRSQQVMDLESVQMHIMQSDIIQVEDTWGIPPIPNQTRIDINPGNVLNNFKDDKLLILYHKGTSYRHNSEKIHKGAEERFKCKVLHFVSTPDLLQLHEDTIWMPNIIDIDSGGPGPTMFKLAPPKPVDDDLIRIIHPYTNDDNFGTKEVFKAIKALKAEGHPIIFYAIQNRPWAECMRLMAQCDIHIGKVIDNLHNPRSMDKIFLPYGVGTIEAGAYKIPTITSIPYESQRTDREPECTSSLPVANARPDNIKEVLEDLIGALPESNLGEKMYKYVRKYHDIKAVCKKYDEIVRTEMA